MTRAVSTARTNGLDTTRTGWPRAAAMAAACRWPRSVNGGSALPRRSPAALAAVWPCRARISTSGGAGEGGAVSLANQDAAAVVTPFEDVIRLAPQPGHLCRRQGQVTAGALVADEAGRPRASQLLSQLLVLGQQLGGHLGGGGVAALLLHRQLGVDLGFGRHA